jgi:hypothetical protein
MLAEPVFFSRVSEITPPRATPTEAAMNGSTAKKQT